MRLVDADNARECFGGDGVTGAVMKRMFDSLPTIDAVPVVRCRECGNYGKIGDCKSLDLLICIHSDTINHNFFPDPDFFCSYGQRKEAAYD